MTGSSSCVVIGAGLAGAATAWRLALAGHQTTVLERSSPANAEGSSHGSARILRYAYPSRFYTDLVIESRPLWDELERDSGAQVVTTTGALDSGEVRGPRQLASVLESAGIEHELLSSDAAAERFPMLAAETDVLWHPDAGVIDAERAVHAMLDLARRHGAQVRTDWEVETVERTRTGHRVTSATGEQIATHRVIVCAGGWLPDLLPRLPLPAELLTALPELVVRQEQAYHFPYRELPSQAGPATPWPSFIHKSRDIQVYGLPGGRDADFAGQKVSEFAGGRRIPSARAHDGTIDPENRRRVTEFVARHLPGVGPTPYAETTCLFTSTPTEDFLIDEHEGITLVSPCSGHGAKFAPLIGELAAGLATGTGTVPELFRAGSTRPFVRST